MVDKPINKALNKVREFLYMDSRQGAKLKRQFIKFSFHCNTVQPDYLCNSLTIPSTLCRSDCYFKKSSQFALHPENLNKRNFPRKFSSLFNNIQRLIVYSLLLWLNVKSSVVIASDGMKEQTLNDTLNTTTYLEGNNKSIAGKNIVFEFHNKKQQQLQLRLKHNRTDSIVNVSTISRVFGTVGYTDSFTSFSVDFLNNNTAGSITTWDLPPIQTIFVTIILLFVILGTIVGNILVCIAVCMVRKLRRPCNYLLVSLALSDLCVAVLVMPIALLYEVLKKWNFGPLLCDIWVSFDVLCCTASILNLCAISVDRYLAITKPLEYGVKRTPRRMMICVALVWLAAACISLPPLLILGNEHVDEMGTPTCAVCQNFAYQIYATLGSFYIPLAVMLFVYYQIFRAARRIVLEEKRAQTHLQHALNGTGSSPPVHTELDCVGGVGSGGISIDQQQQHRHSSYGNTSLNYGGAIGIAGQRGGGSGCSGLLGSPHNKKLRFQLAKEKKASTTLGIIMSAFTICWLPFFILALIRPFVESENVHVPATLSSLFLWLGYANSLLNPIIYATLNRDFRKPFQEILYFRCSSLNTMMRENYYQDQYGEAPSQRVMLGDERQGARESFL